MFDVARVCAGGIRASEKGRGAGKLTLQSVHFCSSG